VKIYNYHPETKEYLFSFDANLNPLESKIQGKDVFLIPANTTIKKPPKLRKDTVACFIDGKWELYLDYRGVTVYDKETGDPVTITKIGDDPFTGSITYSDKPITISFEKTYKETRVDVYPQITEQLDMLYWDMINGTTNWKDTITKIKTDIPKE